MNAKIISTIVAGLTFGVLAAGFTTEADAEPISIAITAEVDIVADPAGFLGGAIDVGDVITGTYVYESTTPDTNPLPTVGDYRHTTASFGITLNAGGLVFRTDPDNVEFLVEIVNDHGTPARDNYLLRSENNIFDIPGPSATENHISWQLDDPTSTALSSEALPTVPPVLADWQEIGGGLQIESGDGDDDFFIRALVTSAKLISPGFTPEEQTEEVIESLQEIIDNNPGTALADKVEDAMTKAQTALSALNKTPPDNQAAVGSLEGAVGDLEAAVKDGLLDAAHGTQLTDQLAEVARHLAADAIDKAIAVGGNQGKINDAQQALAQGDALRVSGKFKDAVSKYKDALAKAESALS